MSTKKLTDISGVSVPILLVMNEEPDRAAIAEYIGNDEIFMFTLGYCEPPEDFGELMRYRRELDLAAGRKRGFSGTALIDLSKWAGCEDSIYFDAFLAYLYDNGEGVSYVFAVNSPEYSAVYDKLSEYFAVDTVQLNVCRGELLNSHIKGYFQSKGTRISDTALGELCAMLERCADEQAYGLRRLETVCDRLISGARGGVVGKAQIKSLCATYAKENSLETTPADERS